MPRSLLLALALLAVLAVAPAAEARDQIVTSFDGTPLATSFFPAAGLKPGQRAPTILMTHGWGGNRETNPDAGGIEALGTAGVGALRRAGFNVLTWDSRGFGQSGGTVTVDYQGNEGRDVSSLLSWLAGQPEAQLDKPGDPRAGMHGPSYAGGIEYVAAAIDPRIDAIAPAIGWHSLLTALYKEETPKSGWGSILYAGGAPSATAGGAVSPAGMQTGSLDPHITSAFTSGLATGHFSPEDRAWFDSRGPGDALISRIRVPTFILQGTADTLFTLNEAIANEAILRRDGVTHKMMWFCGGHGVCLSGGGPSGRIEHAVVAWLRRYVARDGSVNTGPGFEWLADDAQWRTSAAFPPPPGAPITASGAGRLVVNPGDAASGTLVAAQPAANAVNVPIPPPRSGTQVVGEPQLTLTYSGTGSTQAGHVFAQIVDDRRGLVLGNQVTPLPVTLDGARHTVARPLEGVAASVAAGAHYHLQITGGSQVYGPVRDAAAIDFASIRLSLPTAAAGGFSGPGGSSGSGLLPSSRHCLSRRRFEIRVKRPHGGARLRSARVWVAGKRVKVRRRHGRLRAIIDLRGRQKQRVRVRIVAVTRSGRRLHDTRVYRTCTPKRKRG